MEEKSHQIVENLVSVKLINGDYPSLQRDQIWFNIVYIGENYAREYAVKIKVLLLPERKVIYQKPMRFEHIFNKSSFAIPLPDFPDDALKSRKNEDFDSNFIVDVKEMDLEFFRKERKKKLKKFESMNL